MKVKDYNSIEEKLREFEKISVDFESELSDFDGLYDKTIKVIADSQYMFNYYHWITSFKDLNIRHISGVKKMLGFDEETFTLSKSISIIHPNFRPFILEYARNAYEMLSDSKYKPLSSKAHYSIQFPVLQSDGEYILVQMNVSIIMVDKQDNPLMNYNRFEVLGKYLGGPILIKPRVYFRTGIDLSEKAKEAEAELSQKVQDFLFKHIAFTAKERAVLKGLGEKKKLSEIAKELDNMSVETLKIHNRHILEKAKNHLSPLFRSARDVAEYLNNMFNF